MKNIKKRTGIIISCIILIIIGNIFIFSIQKEERKVCIKKTMCNSSEDSRFLGCSRFYQESNRENLDIKEKCFRVEVAETLEEQENGLMFRKSLNKDRGMLFLFGRPGNYSFWMKDTLIPLDIIWISENMRVIDIKEGQPENKSFLVPKKEAKYVLEINQGLSKEFGFSEGDSVSITPQID